MPRASPPKIDHPLVGLRNRTNGNYDIESKNNKCRDVTRGEIVGRLEAFVRRASRVRCPKAGAPFCECMRFLEDKPLVVGSVSRAMMDYFDLTPLERKRHVAERLRYADMLKRDDHDPRKDAPQRIFALPLSYEYLEDQQPTNETKEDAGDEEDGSGNSCAEDRQRMIGRAFKHRICSFAFYALHNIGTQMRETLDKYANGDLSVGLHGNAGKKWRGGRRYTEAYESLHDALNALTEAHRELGNNNGDIVLPLQISKRNTYERWCRERGWDVQKSKASTGQYKAASEWEVLPGFYKTEEEAIADGSSAKNVVKLAVTWGVFTRFWNDAFPRLKTQGRVGKGMFGGKYNFEEKKYYT